MKDLKTITASGLIAGGIAGFCSSQGKHFEPQSLETILKFGPSVFGGVFLGYRGLQLAEFFGCGSKDFCSVGPLVAYAGVFGAAVGGLSTIAGYCAGYTFGSVLVK